MVRDFAFVFCMEKIKWRGEWKPLFILFPGLVPPATDNFIWGYSVVKLRGAGLAGDVKSHEAKLSKDKTKAAGHTPPKSMVIVHIFL